MDGLYGERHGDVGQLDTGGDTHPELVIKRVLQRLIQGSFGLPKASPPESGRLNNGIALFDEKLVGCRPYMGSASESGTPEIRGESISVEEADIRVLRKVVADKIQGSRNVLVVTVEPRKDLSLRLLQPQVDCTSLTPAAFLQQTHAPISSNGSRAVQGASVHNDVLDTSRSLTSHIDNGPIEQVSLIENRRYHRQPWSATHKTPQAEPVNRRSPLIAT